jgi:mycofactocin glycosyltransferase
MDVAVIVPTHRRPAGAKRVVDALRAQTFPSDRFEVVVVDDDPAGSVPADLPGCRVLRTERNGGPGAARNLGWRATDAPLLAFVDDDCVPEPGWLAAGVRGLGWDPDLGVVTGVTLRPAGAALDYWTVYREVTWESPWFEGCNVFYRRAALEDAGGFDERLRYGEDAAAGWNVLAAGWRRDVAPAARVVHDVEDRGLRWHVRHAWLERNLVGLAARHPGLRAAAFWRPWAFRREPVALLVAVAGLACRRCWPALPWLWLRRQARGRRLAEQAVVDGVALAGHVSASIRHAVFVL